MQLYPLDGGGWIGKYLPPAASSGAPRKPPATPQAPVSFHDRRRAALFVQLKFP